MNPPPRLLPALLLALLTAVARAGPRASADYSIAADNTDSGGQRAASAAYTHDGSLGGITGISTALSRRKPPRPATSASSPR